jgi:formiminoglutamase
MAQCSWHFIEGYYLRKPESLEVDDHQYMKYTVAYQGYPEEISFYKNRLTEKWWMAVPVSDLGMDKYHIREYLVPCSETDYEVASMNEIPDRWLRTYKKLNQ